MTETDSPMTEWPMDWDEAAAAVEASPDFLSEAIDALANVDEMPGCLRTALVHWFATTEAYDDLVRAKLDEDRRLRLFGL